MRKRKGLTIVEIALYAMLILSIAAAGISSMNGSTTKSVEANNLKDQAFIIDTVLSQWYKSHSGVYPGNLTTLQTMGILSPNFDLTKFIYTTQSSNTQYRLVVTMPIGANYTSPGSKY